MAEKVKPNAAEALELKRQQAAERMQQQHERYNAKLSALLESEQVATAANRIKVQQMFREQLRQNKRGQLYNELEVLVNDFERHLDRKDSVLQLLSRYIQVAEDQRRRSLNTHQQVVSDLLGQLNDRMGMFSEASEDDVARLQAQYAQELEALGEAYSVREKTLTEIQLATVAEEEDLVNQLNDDYKKKITEMRNYNQEQCNLCKTHLTDQNSELERHLLEAHERYKQQTDSKQHQFKILLLKDQQSSATIEKLKQKIDKLTRQLQSWRGKTQATTDEFKQKNMLLQQEKEEAYKEFTDLKQKLTAYRKAELDRQKTLVTAAHEAEDRILSLKEQADRIIRLATLAGRLETEAERVNDVDRLDIEQRREIDREVTELRRQVEDGQIEITTTYPVNIPKIEGKFSKDIDPNQRIEQEEQVLEAVKELQHVQKKIANVTIDRLALQREQQLLDRENRELREALQRFLSVGTMAQGGF